MLQPQRLLFNGQRAQVERFRLRVFPLLVIEVGQVGEACGHIGMLWFLDLLSNGQRAQVERLRLGIPLLGSVERGQAVEACGEASVVVSELFSLLQGSQV